MEAGLTVYTAKGTISGEEVKSAIMDFYEHGPITRNVLWDLTLAVLTDLSTEDIRSISHVHVNPSNCAKTARQLSWHRTIWRSA